MFVLFSLIFSAKEVACLLLTATPCLRVLRVHCTEKSSAEQISSICLIMFTTKILAYCSAFGQMKSDERSSNIYET